MLEDVVVAWDGSARARSALGWAEARHATRRIRLVRVVQDDAIGTDLVPGCRIALDGEARRIRVARPDLVVETEILRGDVERALLLRAAPGSLLVLGAGGPPAARLPHRSAMLARIVRHADGPVALVPLGREAVDGPVIAGVDGTAAGVAAAQVAAAEAVAAGTSLVLVHVHGVDGAPDGWPGDPMDACAREIAEHHPHLLVRQRSVRGDAHRELLLAMAGASMLVVGRHAVPGPGAQLEIDAIIGASGPLLLVRDADIAWTAEPRLATAAVADPP